MDVPELIEAVSTMTGVFINGVSDQMELEPDYIALLALPALLNILDRRIGRADLLESIEESFILIDAVKRRSMN